MREAAWSRLVISLSPRLCWCLFVLAWLKDTSSMPRFWTWLIFVPLSVPELSPGLERELAEMVQLTILLIQLHRIINSSWHSGGPWIANGSFGFHFNWTRRHLAPLKEKNKERKKKARKKERSLWAVWKITNYWSGKEFMKEIIVLTVTLNWFGVTRIILMLTNQLRMHLHYHNFIYFQANEML